MLPEEPLDMYFYHMYFPRRYAVKTITLTIVQYVGYFFIWPAFGVRGETILTSREKLWRMVQNLNKPRFHIFRYNIFFSIFRKLKRWICFDWWLTLIAGTGIKMIVGWHVFTFNNTNYLLTNKTRCCFVITVKVYHFVIIKICDVQCSVLLLVFSTDVFVFGFWWQRCMFEG